MKKNLSIALIIVAAAAVLASVLVIRNRPTAENVNHNANAPAANAPSGNANAPAGGYEQTSSPRLRLAAPLPGSEVQSPLKISGEAAGWYFEASFPVRLLDADGKELASGAATATEDWMTAGFVPFVAELTFAKPSTPTGTLVLKNDNPSGDPARDEFVRIPVRFAESGTACHPTGCSGQVCSDKEMITTCEYLAEYACYASAKCERQSDGNCGWTQTPDLASCLAKNRQ